jgi:hypothetical protein
MCCRACSGYEICQSKAQLRDDCCLQCKYFDSCMELPDEETARPKVNLSKKRYTKK